MSERGTALDAEREALLEGLGAPQKHVSSKYFYDRRGSQLFEAITELDEYYPTRTERTLLTRHSASWIERWRPRAIVELGAGNSDKTRILLDALVAFRRGASAGSYLPMDVSGPFLEASAVRLRAEYPSLRIDPVVGDMTAPGFCEGVDPPRPAMFSLLGSTIGNFTEDAAIRMIASVTDCMAAGDAFLMGADLRPGAGKSVAELERAYNDAQGVTAAFNRNLLHVLNERFAADFDPERFEHRAFYDTGRHRIEMHLVSRGDQVVTVADAPVRFRADETLRTEISCKYDRDTVSRMFRRAGLDLAAWVTDTHGRYAMAIGTP